MVGVRFSKTKARRGRSASTLTEKQRRNWGTWPDFPNTRAAHFSRFKTKPLHQFNWENGIKPRGPLGRSERLLFAVNPHLLAAFAPGITRLGLPLLHELEVASKESIQFLQGAPKGRPALVVRI